MAVAIGIGRFVYTPILPPMAAALGMSKATAGFIASANFLGYLAGALLAATPYVPGSRRRWLIVALAVSALTTGAMGAVSSTPAFLLLRFLGGVASAFGLVFASALVLDRLGAAGRPQLSAVHFGGVGTGMAASAALVSVLTWIGTGWRALWLASGLVSLTAVALVPVLVPDRQDGAPPPTPAGGRSRGLAAFVVAYGLFGFGYVITTTFLVAIVRASPDVRPLEPLVWIVVGLAALPSVALWTRVARAIGIVRAYALACVLEAIGVGASVLWVTPAGVLAGGVLVGGTFMGLTALGLIRARQLATGDVRRTLALMTAAFGLGQIVGPAFAGIVSERSGSFVAPSLVAAAGLLLAAALVMTTAGTEPAR
jgi:predicted MFS family arabinose efflux permease